MSQLERCPYFRARSLIERFHCNAVVDIVDQGLPEDALVTQKPATTALKHSLICILSLEIHTTPATLNIINFYTSTLLHVASTMVFKIVW